MGSDCISSFSLLIFLLCLHDVMQQKLRPGMSILSVFLLTSRLLAEMTSLTFDFSSRQHFVQ